MQFSYGRLLCLLNSTSGTFLINLRRKFRRDAGRGWCEENRQRFALLSSGREKRPHSNVVGSLGKCFVTWCRGIVQTARVGDGPEGRGKIVTTVKVLAWKYTYGALETFKCLFLTNAPSKRRGRLPLAAQSNNIVRALYSQVLLSFSLHFINVRM